MAAVTDVTREEVNKSGEDIIENANKMYQSLSRIKELINASKSYFDSDAGKELRKKFNDSASKFEEFKTYLTEYGEFLKNFSGNIAKFEDAVEEATRQIKGL